MDVALILGLAIPFAGIIIPALKVAMQPAGDADAAKIRTTPQS